MTQNLMMAILIIQNSDQEIILNRHLVKNYLLDLHQEEDQEKSLNLHLDLIVDLILRLE